MRRGLHPQNLAALQLLAIQRFERGEYREGEKLLRTLLDGLPPRKRQELAENFIIQFENAHMTAQAVQSLNFFAWAFATNPDSKGSIRKSAELAQHVVEMTKQQDPLALDALAAAMAANGQYDMAAKPPRWRWIWRHPRATNRWLTPFPGVCICTSRENRASAT